MKLSELLAKQSGVSGRALSTAGTPVAQAARPSDSEAARKEQIPEATVHPPDSEAITPILQAAIVSSDTESRETDAILDAPNAEIFEAGDSEHRLARNMSRLVDENFPWDESQKVAIQLLSHEKHACMTGAAGTGKTTVTKGAADAIVDDLPKLDMTHYWKKPPEEGTPEYEEWLAAKEAEVEDDDDYETPEYLIPAMAMCAYTGRAVQMIQKNFPEDWWGNIMTIHRLLGFAPEWYDIENDDGELVTKVRFVPTYTKFNKLPWKVILIDEAGMLSLDLWHMLLDACTDDCRIIMIGDINQLPPTHGRSVFGFAMSKWPSVELTHIHRQAGVNNSIVDNAWRVVNGDWPATDDPKDPNHKFIMMELNPNPDYAAGQLRKFLKGAQQHGIYDPIRDVVITPINAFKDESAGFALGQEPLNEKLALQFNSDEARYIIDAGKERKHFAVGDKVMATKNDWQSGITNGMVGRIKSIVENPAYTGNKHRFGRVEDVQAYMSMHAEDETVDFSLEDLTAKLNEMDTKKKEKESRDRGPASHMVEIDFGIGRAKENIKIFSNLAEVATIQTAYAMTCHKMQGGEAPVVVIIVHDSHGRILTREWLYTAITRASQLCVVLYTRRGLSKAINNQKIKGKTLAEKVESFNRLMDASQPLGAAVRVKLPEPVRLSGVRDVSKLGFKGQQIKAEEPCKRCGQMSPRQPWCECCVQEEADKLKFMGKQPESERVVVVERVIERTVVVQAPRQETVHGGSIQPEKPKPPSVAGLKLAGFQHASMIRPATKLALPPPEPAPTPKPNPNRHLIRAWRELRDTQNQSQLLLGHREDTAMWTRKQKLEEELRKIEKAFGKFS